MDTEILKVLNKPENLIDNYQIQLPFYGLSPETLEQLLMMLSAIAQGQAPIQEQINKLPTWDNLHETQTPLLQAIVRRQETEISSSEAHIKRELQNQMSDMKTSLNQTIAHRTSELEQTLKARDLSPWKLRLKWAGTGAMLPLVFWGLQWPLKIL